MFVFYLSRLEEHQFHKIRSDFDADWPEIHEISKCNFMSFQRVVKSSKNNVLLHGTRSENEPPAIQST